MSAFALRRVLSPSPAYRLRFVSLQSRTLHISAPAHKKKKQVATQAFQDDSDFDFGFDGTPQEDDFFGSITNSAEGETITIEGEGSQTAARAMKAEMFEVLRTVTLDTLSLRGKMRQPPRMSTIIRLAGWAESKEDLEKVLDVVVAFRNVSRPPSAVTAEEFFGRCTRLGYPEIALEVLTNRPKYGMDLSSLAAARRLLHALAQPRPGYDDVNILPDCLALAELYPIYGFPPASQDIVSCAIVASVMSRQMPKAIEATEESTQTADLQEAWRQIVGELKSAVESWKSQGVSINPRAVHWIRGSFDEVIKELRRKNEDREWMKQFRVELRSLSSAGQSTSL